MDEQDVQACPPEQTTVACPRCGERFAAWHRPSVNLGIERWSEEELRGATTATCPRCATVIDLDARVVDGDNWTLA